MENFETGFISKAIEKPPFSESPAQAFLKKWCEINDSLEACFIERNEWEQRGKSNMLEENDQGGETLFLPHDLHLWELTEVAKKIGQSDSAVESNDQRTKQADDLGQVFEKAGLYLNEYIDDIEEGKEIAQEISQEFYRYGQLIQGKKEVKADLSNTTTLTEEEKDQLDEWFLGKETYQRRLGRLGQKPTKEQKETKRKKLLQVYFKTLSRQGYEADGEAPWEIKKGPIKQLQDKTTKQIKSAIKTPEQEVVSEIFQKGVKKLATEIKGVEETGWRKKVNDFLTSLGFNPIIEQRKLYNILEIPKLKKELQRIRDTGDAEAVAEKELEIAEKIQKAVCSFPYEGEANNPAEMVKNQFVNCVGSSILSGGILEEMGIKYLHASLFNHSVIILVTSDKKAYWRDFTPRNGYINNYQITNERLKDNKKVSDIVNFSSASTKTNLPVTLKNHKGKDIKADLIAGEKGLMHILLYNTGVTLAKLKKSKLASKILEQAINISPNFTRSYFYLGESLYQLENYKASASVHQQAIAINPEEVAFYWGLGKNFLKAKKFKEAVKVYKKAINLEPERSYNYLCLGIALENLSENQDAVKAYQQAINYDSKRASYHLRLANIFLEMGKSKKAAKAYQETIKHDPENTFARALLGQTLCRLNQYKKATATFRETIDIDPEYDFPYYGLGHSLSRLEKYQEAIEAYATFAKLCSNEELSNKAQQKIKELKRKVHSQEEKATSAS